MAQKVNIVLVDDLDGSEATETVTFGLDGTTYEIDLNDKNAAKLRDALAGYVGHGRKVGAAPRRGRKSAAAATGGPSAREIRDWARVQRPRRPRPRPGLRRRPRGVRRRALTSSHAAAQSPPARLGCARHARAGSALFALSGLPLGPDGERVGCQRG